MTTFISSYDIARARTAARRVPKRRREWVEVLVNAFGALLFFAGLSCFYFAALLATEAIDAWKGVAP
jgi:hypothetical protein